MLDEKRFGEMRTAFTDDATGGTASGSAQCPRAPPPLTNGIVDWRAGLPAKAGTNTVVFDQYLASKAYTDLPA